jgi:hypothetical protein
MQVQIAVLMKTQVFWDVTPYCLEKLLQSHAIYLRHGPEGKLTIPTLSRALLLSHGGRKIVHKCP